MLDAFGDQARYIGPIGSATVAKLVHNMAGYAIQTVMAEVLLDGREGGDGPAGIVGSRAPGRAGPQAHLRPRWATSSWSSKYDPPSFALKLAHKDVSLAVGMGRELGVPMRLCNLVLEDFNEALNRPGWETLDSRVPMKMQLDRAGVAIKCDPAAVQAVLDADGT